MIEKTYDYVALDLETTGLSPRDNCIIEIGAVKYIGGVRREAFSCFVNPMMNIPQRITEITGIDDAMVQGAPLIEEALPKLLEFLGNMPLLGHNISFDYGFICQKAYEQGIKYSAAGIDTHYIAKLLLPDIESRSLESLCEYYCIEEEPRHRAFSDAAAAAGLYDRLHDYAQMGFSQDEAYTDKKLSAAFLPGSLTYTAKKNSPITLKQAAFLNSLIRQHGIKFDKDINSLTKSQASREIDMILSAYGRQL